MATTLGNNLIDGLLDTIDDLRTLNDDFGTRSYTVTSVLRTYTGNRQDGYYSEILTLISPTPKVVFKQNRFEMIGGGKFSEDVAEITEISLKYSRDELLPSNLLPNQKHYLRFTDAHGENVADRLFHIKGAPVIDRIHTIGWIITAKEIQDRDWDKNGPK